MDVSTGENLQRKEHPHSNWFILVVKHWIFLLGHTMTWHTQQSNESYHHREAPERFWPVSLLGASPGWLPLQGINGDNVCNGWNLKKAPKGTGKTSTHQNFDNFAGFKMLFCGGVVRFVVISSYASLSSEYHLFFHPNTPSFVSRFETAGGQHVFSSILIPNESVSISSTILYTPYRFLPW